MKAIYILTKEVCNGEYGQIVYCSAHDSVAGAKALQLEILDPKELKGQDAKNVWEETKDGDLEFKTGNWGYVSWHIKKTPLFEGKPKEVQIETQKALLKNTLDEEFGGLPERTDFDKPFDWDAVDKLADEWRAAANKRTEERKKLLESMYDA